ncbi:MAG: extracellular solute-binding protein [Patescibacteria group bacterium]|jgi:multiple sugar transport system substrate-binding protein
MHRFLRPLSYLALASLLVTTGQGCLGGGTTTTAEELTLTIWGVFDDANAYEPLIDAYETLHPNVSIDYRELRYDEYRDELVRAFAEGKGPDIFSVHNTWMGEYQGLMQPMPSQITVSELQTQGTVKRETVNVAVQKPTMTARELEATFVEQIAFDVVRDYQADDNSDVESRIFGLPLSVDSLALFYNKDLLDAAGIATPPTTWTEFQNDVIALTTYNAEGEVDQSGAALGTAENVERAGDILSILMMQNGTAMTDDRGRVTFNLVPDDAGEDVYPGLDAVRFYTDFANPTKEVYTWNDSYSNSFDAFTSGQTAMMLGYSYYIPLVRTAAPKLNFSISKLPQIDGGQEVNFANYWIETVAKNTEHSDWAWDFILFAADEDQVTNYLEAANKPTALRSLIGNDLDDPELGVFAEQTLTAKSWYLGNDIEVAEQALRDLITQMLDGSVEGDEAIDDAAQKVSQTY